MRSVRVEREGPLPPDRVLRLNDRIEDFGLYQIYGRHIIFGPGSLLYIGETNQTFGERFTEHLAWLEEEEEVFIHVGCIVSKDYKQYERTKILKDTEALTIKWHSPPYNSRNIETYNGQRLKVVNQGERGSLVKQYRSRDRKRWGWLGDYS